MAALALWSVCFGIPPPCTETRGRSCVDRPPTKPGRWQCTSLQLGMWNLPEEPLWEVTGDGGVWNEVACVVWMKTSWSSLLPPCLLSHLRLPAVRSCPCPALVSKEKNVHHFIETFPAPTGHYIWVFPPLPSSPTDHTDLSWIDPLLSSLWTLSRTGTWYPAQYTHACTSQNVWVWY